MELRHRVRRLGALVALAAVSAAAPACGPREAPADDGGAPTDDAEPAGDDAGAAADASADAALPPDASPVATTVAARNTGASGEITVTVPVNGHRSFMVVASTAETGARLSVLGITGPNGATLVRWEDWFNAPRGLTNAFFANRAATVINWPVRAQDPALVPGNYVVRLGSYRADGTTSRPNLAVEVTTQTRRDDDPDRGRVRVAIVWADGLARDAALVRATEAAVAHWRDVWRGAGMELDLRYVTSTISPALPYPSAASGAFFLAASRLVQAGEIAVVIGETVDNSPSQYGAAGHLPGPTVSSPLSAIVVGWLANAGGDGVFSASDVRLYGEVLAHEVGHYLGLFHPVYPTYDFWDALPDTPECRARAACQDALGTNLMYPTSICDGGTCVSTTVITRDQRAVMQRYTGTQ